MDNGDELSGQLVGIADGSVKFETDVGPVDVKIDRATAIDLQPRAKTRRPQGNHLQAWVGLSDGSRLLATQLLVDGDSAKLTVAGQPLAASQEKLVFLQPLGGRAVYLSDLKPAEYHQTPFLDLPWPYQSRPERNRRLFALRRAAVSERSRRSQRRPAGLRYLPSPVGRGAGGEGGRCSQRFQAELGIDDSTGGRGSVQFRVLVDGQERFASPIIRGGTPPVPVSVDVAGAEKLELVVDYADRADVLDHADWLNARLTRMKQRKHASAYAPNFASRSAWAIANGMQLHAREMAQAAVQRVPSPNAVNSSGRHVSETNSVGTGCQL